MATANRNGRQSRGRDNDNDRGNGKKQFDRAYDETRRYGSDDTRYANRDRNNERSYAMRADQDFDDQDRGSFDRYQNQSDFQRSDWGRNDRYGRDDERDFNPGSRYRSGNYDQRGYAERGYEQRGYDQAYGRNPMDRNRPGVNFDAEFGNYPRSDRYDENEQYPYSGMGRGRPYGQGWGRNDGRTYAESWGGRGQASGATNQGGFGQYSRDGQRGRSRHDANYLSWRDEQMRKLDADYEDYRRENQSKFNTDFDAWRSKRTTGKSKTDADKTRTSSKASN